MDQGPRFKVQGPRFTVHGSRFTAHGSRLTVHGSRLTAHGSRLTVHGSRLTVHGSRLTAHGSRLTVHGSRFTAHGSRFTAHGSRFTAHGSRCVVKATALAVVSDRGINFPYHFSGKDDRRSDFDLTPHTSHLKPQTWPYNSSSCRRNQSFAFKGSAAVISSRNFSLLSLSKGFTLMSFLV